MNENEFRRRLKDALGETPAMAPPTLSRPAASATQPQPRLVAIVAFVLAVVLVVVLVATRISFHPTGSVAPAGKSGPSPTAQAAADSFPCALPVLEVSEFGNSGQPGQVITTAGFVNLPDGGYQVDPSADVRGLPASTGFTAPITYSPQLKRWLPAPVSALSPDGRSYAYQSLVPAGATYQNFRSAELHVFDPATKSDRKVWSYVGSIDIVRWRQNGILVDTVPPQGGVQLWWLIDPVSGSATPQPGSVNPLMIPPSAKAGYHSFSYLGGDASTEGAVFLLGSRDPGAKYTVILVKRGAVTTIYSGVAGGAATQFFPEAPYFDAHGLWFGNFDGSVIWLWTAAQGLRKFSVHGGPAPAAGYQFNYLTFDPHGPCVPGTFTGVKPSPLPPATSPSPSPSPPVVDWSTLQSRPLRLQQLSPGVACPVSASVTLDVKAQSGKWPNYGFGPGPAYVSGQYMWYSNGPQAMLILTDPQYQGPVLIRAQRLDGSGSVELTGGGLQTLSDGSFGLPQTSSPPYWGTSIETIAPSTPGCYGIQLDGTSFTAVVVIQVRKGPPPPG